MQRFWSSILLSTLGCSVTTRERVLRRSALCAGRPVFVLARHRHREGAEHHRRACSAEGADQQCVAWTRNPDQTRNSAHQKPGSRGTRRLAVHQRTLRMTRAQHRLRSCTAAERGWQRTRHTLRTVPICVLGLSAHKARRPIGVLARRQRRRPMAGVRCARRRRCRSSKAPSLAENFDCEALALSFRSQSVREFRRGVPR